MCAKADVEIERTAGVDRTKRDGGCKECVEKRVGEKESADSRGVQGALERLVGVRGWKAEKGSGGERDGGDEQAAETRRGSSSYRTAPSKTGRRQGERMTTRRAEAK